MKIFMYKRAKVDFGVFTETPWGRCSLQCTSLISCYNNKVRVDASTLGETKNLPMGRMFLLPFPFRMPCNLGVCSAAAVPRG